MTQLVHVSFVVLKYFSLLRVYLIVNSFIYKWVMNPNRLSDKRPAFNEECWLLLYHNKYPEDYKLLPRRV